MVNKEKDVIFSLLKNIKYGKINIYFSQKDTPSLSFCGIENEDLEVNLQIHNLDFFKKIISRKDVGLGESYIDSDFEVDDLEKFIIILIKNYSVLASVAFGYTLKEKIKFVWLHFKNRNTKSGSRKNISSHYDVGNEFYKLWLDESMFYSSGLFLNESDTLEQSQINKVNRIMQQIGGAKNVWEIGCGWGGFLRAAIKQNKNVRGISLSKEQLKICDERIEKENNSENKSVALFEDYRSTSENIKDKFDAVVSIEMIEAVGQKYWATYFESIKNNLKDGGVGVIQVILKTPDEDYQRYLKSTDFIREYTFPGGLLMGREQMRADMQKAGLEIVDWYEFAKDYQKTLQLWLIAFDEHKQEILNMGYSQEFIRSWRFYMSSCAACFDTGEASVAQVTFKKI